MTAPFQGLVLSSALLTRAAHGLVLVRPFRALFDYSQSLLAQVLEMVRSL